MPEVREILSDISNLKTFWNERNRKFKEWYEFLLMVDTLAAKGMESYVSNEPATFYQMAHYLLTQGKLTHSIPVASESIVDLDIQARVHRGCESMWNIINRDRRLGGDKAFIDDLSFYILVLGWYSIALAYEKETGQLKTQIWNPSETFPRYANNQMITCVHSYKVTQTEANLKVSNNGWSYKPRNSSNEDVYLDDYFVLDKGIWKNLIFIDNLPVIDWTPRPEMNLLVAPVGGFPDKGSILSTGRTRNTKDWRGLIGKGIFEINETVAISFNKWKSMVSQILRDTAQPITQEFSATPQATPEQIRERGALFHYAPGERGLERVAPASIPIEIQANLQELRREQQKGSFSDAVFGMVAGQPGYALSLLASSSANQILYPYMDGKHFVISEADKFWLTNLKTSNKVFNIRGKLIEQLKPSDIPDDVFVIVESDVATPKDWLERGTIGGMVRQDLDNTTLLTEIYRLPDPQGILRRKVQDRVLNNPMSQLVQMISGFYAQADYLSKNGDMKQAELFRKAALAAESQLGAPAPGQGQPLDMTRIQSQRLAGAPSPVPPVPSTVSPPEQAGFTPAQLRTSIGQGSVRNIRGVRNAPTR